MRFLKRFINNKMFLSILSFKEKKKKNAHQTHYRMPLVSDSLSNAISLLSNFLNTMMT